MPPERTTYFWNDLPGYRMDLVPRDDGLYYWHVFRWAERVNGGLSETPHQARQGAGLAAFRDLMQREDEDQVVYRRLRNDEQDDGYESWERDSPGRGA